MSCYGEKTKLQNHLVQSNRWVLVQKATNEKQQHAKTYRQEKRSQKSLVF